MAWGERAPSTCSDRTRSAPTSLASAARCSSLAPLCGPRVSQEVTPRALEPALHPGGEVPGEFGLDQPVVGGAGVAAAVAGVDDDPLAQQVRPGRGHLHHLAQQLRPAADHPAAELAQRAQGGRAADGVGDQAGFALEGLQGGGGLRTEDAVGAADVVAELEQLVLQGGDVVAGLGGAAGVGQHPVAETPVRPGEGGVGLLAHAAVDRDAATLLEVPHRQFGGLVEHVVMAGRRCCPATRGRPAGAGRRRHRRRGRRGAASASVGSSERVGGRKALAGAARVSLCRSPDVAESRTRQRPNSKHRRPFAVTQPRRDDGGVAGRTGRSGRPNG